MNSILALVCALALASQICRAAEEPTSVTIGETTYGAHADQRGPIGGGLGYTAVVTQGDYVVQDLDGLLEALAKARAGQTVFIPGETEIHHNFIHHCQYNGLGYGVSHARASSLIEYNRFDWNRHSIAGTGRPGCGYLARHNIELGESLSHCFDMHGGRDRKDGTDIAGTTIEIYSNTFRASQPAVVIRGVPEEKCDVHHNWFPRHAQPQQAVRAAAKTLVHDNAYGAKPKDMQ